MEEFGQSFLRAIAGAYELDERVAAELGPALRRHLQAAREAWPSVQLSGELFAEHLALHAPHADEPTSALERMETTDMYLALACSRGDRDAIALLERNVLMHVPKAVGRVDGDPDFVQEVLEETRIRLLVGDGRPPRIERYAGRGPLLSWVMVVAVRAAYSLKRARRQALPEDPTFEWVVEGDAELEQLRDELEEPFREAFGAALAALSTRERAVLRLYFVEELSSESIGTMYQVHRATVARWITAARSKVYKRTRAALMKRLSVGGSTFDSLMRNLLSRLDLPLATSLDEG